MDLFIKEGGELPLSEDALREFLGLVLSKGASFRFRAKGFSMLPFIKDGDLITVSPLRDVSPHLGDVLAFIHPREKKLFIHRMVGKKRSSYLLRGDSLPEADGLVPKANFLGKVEKVERDGKPVSLGLGPERFIIAFLTRRNLFLPLYIASWKLIGPLLKRFKR